MRTLNCGHVVTDLAPRRHDVDGFSMCADCAKASDALLDLRLGDLIDRFGLDDVKRAMKRATA